MNKVIYALLACVLFIACEKDEITIPKERETNLRVKWNLEHKSPGRKPSARLDVYDSEEAFRDPIGKPIETKSLEDALRDESARGNIEFGTDVYGLEPLKKYWLRIIHVNGRENYIETNNDDTSVVLEPLFKNTHTTLSIDTKRHYLASYTFDRMEVNIPIHEFSPHRIGDTVNVYLKRSSPSPLGKIVDSTTAIINDNSFIIYESTNGYTHHTSLYTYQPTYSLHIRNKLGHGSSEVRADISIYDLINSNGYLGNKYISSSSGIIGYKLYTNLEFDE